MVNRTVGAKFGLTLVSLVATVLASAGTAQAAAPTINVVLGVANALQVTYNGATLGSSSAPGASIPPGAYQVVVDNSIGDVGFTFHLSGPGVSLQTDVAGGEQDTETWDETFQASSTYQFEDDTNPAATLRFFSTASTGGVGSIGAAAGAGAAGSGSTSSTGGAVGSKAAAGTTKKAMPLPKRGTLVGSVSAAGALKLEHDGKPVARLEPGRYTIRVTDKTKRNGFILQESGRPSKSLTTAPFVGVKSVTVSMPAGQWFFYPTFIGAKVFFAVIA
jgi:hypothetical protein